MSALQMMEDLSLIEEQGEYLELTENDHVFRREAAAGRCSGLAGPEHGGYNPPDGGE